MRKLISSILIILIIVWSVHAQHYPGATWDTRTPAEAGFDTSSFNTALGNIPSPCMVVRDGYKIGSNGNVATTGLIWSGSKSMVALVAGRLIQQSSIALTDPIPNSDEPTAPEATLAEFLSMTSDWNLDAPSHDPGGHFAYNNGAIHFYGTYLKDTFFASQTHVQFLQNAYTNTIGFENSITYNNAVGNYMSGWGGGWTMSTQDLARVGWLVASGGGWNATQIISSSFINDLYTDKLGSATASTDHPDIDPLAQGVSNQFNNEDILTNEMANNYSYGFWLGQNSAALIEGSNADTESIYILGAFGTQVWISRQYNFVIACANTGGGSQNPGPLVSGNEFDAFINAIIANPIRTRYGGKVRPAGKVRM
jgi:CubicO group peptidase (beta-lactamase class C family)